MWKNYRYYEKQSHKCDKRMNLPRNRCKSKKKSKPTRVYSFVRYSLGVQPKEALKHLLKYLGSENPQA